MSRLRIGLLSLFVILSFLSFFNTFTRSFSINADKASQLEATKSFSQGLGLTVESVDLHDLAKSKRKPLIGWPPGYSLLLLALTPVTTDFIVATNLLNIFFLLLYLIISYLILRILNIPYECMLLFYAFTIVTNQPILTLTTTDLISFVCFLGLFYLLIHAFKYQTGSWGFFCVIGILGFSAVFVKYNFLGFVFLFPLSFILLGWVQKKKRFIYGGILSGVIMGMFVSGFLIYQKFFTGHYTYLSAYASGGWHFDNLRDFSPFLFELLFARDPFKVFPFELPILIRSLPLLFTIATLLAILLIFIYRLRKVYFERSLNENALTFLFGSAISYMNAGMLFYLSITSPAQDGHWTYVEEFRYYAPACFFFLIFILMGASRQAPALKKMAVVVLVLSVIFGVANKIYKITTYGYAAAFDRNKLSLSSKYDDQVKMLNKVKEIVDKDLNVPVVYGDASSNQRFMSLAGAHTVWEFSDFVKMDSLASSGPVVVLIGTFSDDNADVAKFIDEHKFKEVYTEGDVKLFERDLNLP